MEISRIRALRGPNLWSRQTAVEAIIACDANECDISGYDGLEARLRDLFPRLGPVSAVKPDQPVSIAHVVEHAALRFQAEAGCPVSFSRTKATLEEGVFQIVVEYTQEAVGRLALEMAERFCRAAMTGGTFDLDGALARLQALDEDKRLGPSTGAIVDAAIARNIPYYRLTEGSMVQFGWGRKQRRIWAAEMDSTSAIAEAIAQDKGLTKMLLHAAGLPVPAGRTVADIDDAWKAAEEIGLPVVVKPLDGNQGKGVTVNITARRQMEMAYAAAEKFGSEVIVERFIQGYDHRLLVVGGKLAAASRRDPAHVVGDGVQTIRALVDEVNQDPRRRDGHATALSRIKLDDIALAQLASEGLTPESIPAHGQRVLLRNNANLSTGGTATDVTDDVHPEMAACAILAAQTVGLDICGVDIVCGSVLKSLEEQSGGIVEVNAGPGLRMHLSPSFGKSRNVGETIVETLYERDDDGRIPIVAVTGTNGKTTTVYLVNHLLSASGLTVGMTNTDGISIGGERIDAGDCSGPRSARAVLMHPDVDAAVFETARGGILREGLAYDRCKVAIVTNVGTGDHLGLNYIMTVEDLAVLKRVIVQNVADDGMAVLNAADPIVVEMAGICPGDVTFFALDGRNPALALHRARGGWVLFRDGDAIVAAEGQKQQRLPLAVIPLTRDGQISFQVENVMASIGAAWALDLSWDTIREALSTFSAGLHAAPGRFNVLTGRGVTVIADYGHNPDAVAALSAAVETIPARARSVMISAAGDRRDEDIRQQTEILGRIFDHVILYEEACQRGREQGETIRLLREGLKDAPRTKQVDEVYGERTAIDLMLGRLKEGDLAVVLVDDIENTVRYLEDWIGANQG